MHTPRICTKKKKVINLSKQQHTMVTIGIALIHLNPKHITGTTQQQQQQ